MTFALFVTQLNLFAYTDLKSIFYFDTDIDTLDSKQYQQLHQFIDNTISTKKYKEIYVSGFTDADGSSQYNIDLSKRRAEFITNQLIKFGLPQTLIDRNYKGENNPLAKNTNEVNKSKNRRVEITLRLFDIKTASDVVKELNGNEEQVYILDNTKENYIEGKDGIKIIFPPYCFDIKGNKKSDFEKIKIILTEVTNVRQAFFSNVLTESNDGLLETGGMYKVIAQLNNTDLKMKNNMQYTVQINNQKLKDNMSVYLPQDSSSNGLVKWKNTNTNFEKASTFKGVRPFLKLDEKLINNWHLHSKFDSIIASAKVHFPIKPISPTVSKRPFLPYQPKITSSRYKVPWYKKMFMSKAKQEKVIHKYYDMDMEVYSKQMDKYNIKLAQFISDSSSYSNRMSKYKITYTAFSDSMYQLAVALDIYKGALFEKAFVESFESVKAKVLQLLKDKKLFTRDFYTYVLQECNKNYFKLNSKASMLSIYSTYAERFKQIYNVEPHQIKSTRRYNVSNCDDPYIYPYLFKTDFNNLLLENKEIYKMVTAAESIFVDEELKSGIFDPTNFRLYYNASLSNFGWINCDRFVNSKPEDIFTLQVPNYKLEDKNIFAIVKDIGSQIQIPIGANGIHQVRLPKNKEIVIVAIGLDQNLMPMYAKQTVFLNNNLKVDLSFKSAKLSEIKEMINSI